MNQRLRRPSIRRIAAALALIPLASTCTMPQTLRVAAGEQFSLAQEEQLMGFLIDGDEARAR